jgi:hypothetical protein
MRETATVSNNINGNTVDNDGAVEAAANTNNLIYE